MRNEMKTEAAWLHNTCTCSHDMGRGMNYMYVLKNDGSPSNSIHFSTGKPTTCTRICSHSYMYIAVILTCLIFSQSFM